MQHFTLNLLFPRQRSFPTSPTCSGRLLLGGFLLHLLFKPEDGYETSVNFQMHDVATQTIARFTFLF
jgi:hypothetical protein